MNKPDTPPSATPVAPDAAQDIRPKPHPSQQSAAGEEDPDSGLDAADSAIRPDGVAPSAQAYENTLPGTDHNDPAGPKPYEGGNIARTMMEYAQTDAERGTPGLTAEEIRAMKR